MALAHARDVEPSRPAEGHRVMLGHLPAAARVTEGTAAAPAPAP